MTTGSLRSSIRLALALGAIACVAAACAYRHEKGDAGGISGGNRNQSGGGSPSFAEVRDRVIGPECSGCHAGFVEYGQAYAKRDAIRDRVFVVGNMPKGGKLTDDESALLRAWLDAGAPEPAIASPAASPTPQSTAGSIETAPRPDTAPTWNDVQSGFFKPNCTKCHSGPDADGGIDLTDYDQVKGNADDILDQVFVERAMPPKPQLYARMTEASKNLLTRWMDAGMTPPEGYVPPAPNPSASASASAAPAPLSSPEPVSSPSTPPSPQPVPAITLQPADASSAWTRMQNEFFAPFCITCHSGPRPKGRLDLTDFDAAHAAADKIRKTVLEKGSMPPSRIRAKMAQGDFDKLQAWLDAGAPNSSEPRP
jgi:uncharacterized membrane protein